VLKVIQFVRKPASAAFSIEQVDTNIRRALPSDISVQIIENKYLSKGIFPRLLDSLRAIRYAGEVNHITGDVNYLTYFLPKKRTLLTIHDTEMVNRSKGIKRFLLWFFWIWLPVRRCAAIITISQETKAQLLKLTKCDPDKITVINNPVKPGLTQMPYSSQNNGFRLLHIGTKANKNLGRVIDAVAGLDLELTIIGPLTDEHENKLKHHNINYRNLVSITDQEVRNAYGNAHALIFVSTSEGFGLPIVEAQAIGRPVITSARAPMNDIAGGGALLVDPEDIDAIHKACMRLMADLTLRNQMIEFGLTNARRFNAVTIAQSYAGQYKRFKEI